MRVVLEVVMDVRPTEEQVAYARRAYEPTLESPTPDDEWILEEVAMTLLTEEVKEIEQVTVIESDGNVWIVNRGMKQ